MISNVFVDKFSKTKKIGENCIDLYTKVEKWVYDSFNLLWKEWLPHLA